MALHTPNVLHNLLLVYFVAVGSRHTTKTAISRTSRAPSLATTGLKKRPTYLARGGPEFDTMSNKQDGEGVRLLDNSTITVVVRIGYMPKARVAGGVNGIV